MKGGGGGRGLVEAPNLLTTSLVNRNCPLSVKRCLFDSSCAVLLSLICTGAESGVHAKIKIP